MISRYLLKKYVIHFSFLCMHHLLLKCFIFALTTTKNENKFLKYKQEIKVEIKKKTKSSQGYDCFDLFPSSNSGMFI